MPLGFNSLLEMRGSVYAKNFSVYVHFSIQFSIGDAYRDNKRLPRHNRRKVSILYWRCRCATRWRSSTRPGTFQFSIGDAVELSSLLMASADICFNSLLEMLCVPWWVVAVAVFLAVSILYWRCEANLLLPGGG